MANISTTDGKLTLTGATKSIHAFIQLTRRMEDWAYGIVIPNREELLGELQSHPEIKDDKESTIFYGTGRWNFENTIKTLFNQCLYEQIEKDLGWTPDMQAAWDQINNDPITLLFDYTDHDETAFLVKEKVEVTWIKKALPAVTVNMLEQMDIPLTAENFEKWLDEDDTFYDYTSYTLINNILGDQTINLAKELNETPLVDEIKAANIDFSTPDDPKTKAVLTDWGNALDALFESGLNALWREVEEWFEDENVQDALSSSITKQQTA